MYERKINLKIILIAVPVVAVIIAGILWAKQYYDYRYALEDYYYAVVPLDYDITPVKANAGGELITYYALTFYNSDGEARELEGRVRINMHDLYPPGTYLEFSASKQFVIGQRALDEKDVPEKALKKSKRHTRRLPRPRWLNMRKREPANSKKIIRPQIFPALPMIIF